jgi:prepilin-type N-terminal cleavage/methylation domain-containing protein
MERGTQGVRLFHKNQLGFTLTELILAIAIAGIITGGITMTIFQVFSGSARTSNHMTAVRQVQNAGYWVSLDTQMAKIVDAPGATGFPLTLTWTDWANDDHQVVYSLLADNKLQRSHSINDGTAETAIIAEYINPAMTSCDFTDTNDDDIDDTLILNVTATVGEQTETRVYEVIPRPGS